MNKTIGLAVIAVLLQTIRAQHLTEEEKEILILQDQRSLSSGRLASYLSHSTAKLRYRAAIAYANIQDSSTVRLLTPLLRDSDGSVRAAASFALGQVGVGGAKEALLEALPQEKNNMAVSRILEALGRCGDQAALDELISYIPSEKTVRRDQAMAVARFALRNIKSERSVWFCFDLLEEGDPEIQWRALYALWRSAPHGLIDVEISKRRDQLREIAASLSPDVRMQLATLLGRSKSADATDLLQAIEKARMSKEDWQVQVQLVRSFGTFVPKKPELLGRIIFYMDSPNEHVKIATLQALALQARDIVRNSPLKEKLGQALMKISKTAMKGSKSVQSVQGEALVTLGKHFPDDLSELSTLLLTNETSPLLKAKILEGLSFNASARTLEIFVERLSDESVRVSMAAWDFVKRLFSANSVAVLTSEYPQWSEIDAILYKKINASLSGNDMGVSTLVAGALSDSSFLSIFREAGYRGKIVQDLMNAYEKFSTPDDVEAMQSILSALGALKDTSAVPLLEKALEDSDKTVAIEAAKALQRITGQDYSSRIPTSSKPNHTDYDWQAFDSIATNQKVVIRTGKGSVTLQLMKEHAPFTVLSFVKLIKKGFFNGLNFHRVVPNFVVQGGDPRGDGWGGPGYSIRSEYSLVNYERGTVGVASAGKDTEGCQFFITHSPQPHLDGRYTILGRVVAGKDVVDKLQVGDKIVQMKLSN